MPTLCHCHLVSAANLKPCIIIRRRTKPATNQQPAHLPRFCNLINLIRASQQFNYGDANKAACNDEFYLPALREEAVAGIAGFTGFAGFRRVSCFRDNGTGRNMHVNNY
ncbi:hypothetical protein Zmor_004437 [Zophobas morio]|uniref:Uncharacterized protein n=1 Tax=Zophobas morio TaxID=2755281 RepID=A0AA38M1V4_9CUCU|nr:hypothetical protein Zmor_004437 [Zophobas morio]